MNPMKVTPKVTTIALAALGSTTHSAPARSVVAPSVGSYQSSVGSSNVAPTWSTSATRRDDA